MRLSTVGVVALVLLVGCGEDKKSTPPTLDSTPPSAIQDLTAREVAGRRVLLGWTAPGDDGASGQATRYDLRRATLPITESNWGAATAILNAPVPQAGGRLEQAFLDSLPFATWYFAVKATDEANNTGALSNIAQFDLVDAVPPSAITDLTIGAVSTRTISLSWTAPGGDDGAGRAAEYELRTSASEINEQNWTKATPVLGTPTPAPAGTREAFTASDLVPNTTYYFALVSIDEHPNRSALSNVVHATTSAVNVTRLTVSTHAQGAANPDWSRDGSRIAFQADWEQKNPSPDIYTMSRTGTEVTRLTSIPESEFAPRWSPKGDEILYTVWRDSVDALWREVRSIAASSGSIPKVLLRDPGQRLGTAAWSPTGDAIAYNRSVAEFPSRASEIRVTDLITRKTRTVRSAGDASFRPDWSPDGTRIAFNADGTGNSEVYTIRADGSDEVRLTDEDGSDGSPRWSPDGTKIAFSSPRNGTLDVWVMNADGSNPTQLTSTPDAEGQPTWSPDGTQIAFVRSIDGIADIWVIDLED